MASKLSIDLHGASLNIVRRSKLELRDILQSKFGCTIAGQCLEEGMSTAQQRPAVTPVRRFETVLSSGVKVSVWKADLTNFHVEAVVNAANEHLQHAGGLAGALSEAGGDKIQKDSTDHIHTYGPVKTGNAIISDAGLLSCQKIIHAVGPQLSKFASKSDVAQAKPLLEKAIMSILDIVKENRLNTVAIPAISSGLFHYPLPLCAVTIVTTVKHYFDKSLPHDFFPKEVLFVNNDDPTVNEMDRACRTILGNTPTLYSHAAADQSKGATRTVKIGNLSVVLKQGKIEEQRTDVIVNSISSDLNLKMGVISTAILQKAGFKMQHEIHKSPVMRNIVITRGYDLNCKEVFHMKHEPESQMKRIVQKLSESVRECLWAATEHSHRSIAFPAIATGNLGLNKSKAANIMLSETANFAQSAQRPMEVHFVIFPSDKETFKAFESEMKVLQGKASKFKLPQVGYGEGSSKTPEYMPQYSPTEQQVWGNEDDYFNGSRSSTPQIILSSPSNENTQEAKLWLCGILKNSFTFASICNNFIQYFGEQDFWLLSQKNRQGMQMEEFFEKGRAGITIFGSSVEDLAVFTIQVEALLCRVQRDFITEEVAAIRHLLPNTEIVFERKTLDKHSSEFQRIFSTFKHQDLKVLKVEEVENNALKLLFDMKKKQLFCSKTQTMVQRLPAQFCEMVSHIGFHAVCAPPVDPQCGEGIYFAGSVQKAMSMWKNTDQEFKYFVEAEVIPGKSTPGKPGLILPPCLTSDPHTHYDSVNGGADILVIFSSYQALPKYIITCNTI